MPTPWTMKDVQQQLCEILLADHPLTADQRRALKGVIEMCEVWNKMAPGFHKIVEEFELKGVIKPAPAEK